MRRSEYDIMADILRACQQGTRKTAIVYKCNLNFQTAAVYIDPLINAQALALTGKVFLTTAKGKHLIEQIEALPKFFGGD